MSELFTRIKGNVLALTAMCMFAIVLLMSFAIDIAQLLAARNQLQVAVDAAALAGASGLVNSQATATSRAISFGSRNNCLNQAVQLSAGNISFPSAERIRVHANRSVPFYFAGLIGIYNVNINAAASAELFDVGGINGLRPFAVPDFPYVMGDQVLIKSGDDKDDPCRTACWHYPVCYPPINRGTPDKGASIYRERIEEGYDGWVFADDLLLTEPGNMVGPTKQGVEYVIEQDPNAYWNGAQIANSAFPGNSSPRIIIVPFFDHTITPKGGRADLTVTGFGSFFLLGLDGKDVYGIFLSYVKAGKAGDTSPNTSIKMVRLIS